MSRFDVKVVDSPKLDFGKKICCWLDLKLVQIGETGRLVDYGLYLLPTENEKAFMLLRTWMCGCPMKFVLQTNIMGKAMHAWAGEEELFYSQFLNAKTLYAFSAVKDTWKVMQNPLLEKSASEAEIWLDLNPEYGHLMWQT